MKKYLLFVDESGNLDLYNLKSRFYILCGTAVEDSKKDEIKVLADQIKFKYWGETNIVFHSREISRNEGKFAIFKNNPELKKEFITDLLNFLNKAPFMIFPVIVDKQALDKRKWNKIKIIQKTLTSISFVTKHNHDIEEQISDMLAYAVLCKYCQMTKQQYRKTQHEEKLIRILNKKLFRAPPNAGKRKKHFFDQIKSLGIIPENILSK